MGKTEEQEVIKEVTERVAESLETEEGRERLSKGIRQYVENSMNLHITRFKQEKAETSRDIMNSENAQESLRLFEQTIKYLLDIATGNVEEESSEKDSISRFELLDLD